MGKLARALALLALARPLPQLSLRPPSPSYPRLRHAAKGSSHKPLNSLWLQAHIFWKARGAGPPALQHTLAALRQLPASTCAS